MNRLTRKSNREYYETHIRSVDENYTYEQFLKDRPYTLHHIHSVEYETKLGKLEDLEEELGCPLEVVFKALRTGICIKDEQYLQFPDFGLYNEKFALYAVGANNSMLAHRNTFYTKDYQKTWWLKR